MPTAPAQTAEESARHAVFWALLEIEHIVRELGKRVEAGEAVRMRSGIYTHTLGRVDFDLRIVEHTEVIIELPAPGGGG